MFPFYSAYIPLPSFLQSVQASTPLTEDAAYVLANVVSQRTIDLPPGSAEQIDESPTETAFNSTKQSGKGWGWNDDRQAILARNTDYWLEVKKVVDENRRSLAMPEFSSAPEKDSVQQRSDSEGLATTSGFESQGTASDRTELAATFEQIDTLGVHISENQAVTRHLREDFRRGMKELSKLVAQL